MKREFYSIQLNGLNGELLFESLVEHCDDEKMNVAAFAQALDFLEDEYYKILPTIQTTPLGERLLTLDCFLKEKHIAGVCFREKYLAQEREDVWGVAFKRFRQEIQLKLFKTL